MSALLQRLLNNAMSKKAFTPMPGGQMPQPPMPAPAQDPMAQGGMPPQGAPQGMPPQGAPQGAPQQGGQQMDPQTGLPIDPNTGMPMDPQSGLLVDMQNQVLIDPQSGQPVADLQGNPIQGGAPQGGMPGVGGSGMEQGNVMDMPIGDLPLSEFKQMLREVVADVITGGKPEKGEGEKDQKDAASGAILEKLDLLTQALMGGGQGQPAPQEQAPQGGMQVQASVKSRADSILARLRKS